MKEHVKDLLSLLRTNNIRLFLKNDNIEVKSYSKTIPAELVQAIKQHKQEIIAYLKAQDKAHLNTIPVAEIAESYPLSAAQKRVWVISQYEKLASLYNIYDYRILQKETQVENLKKAVHAVVTRHEILRSVYKEVNNDGVRQYIVPTEEIDFEVQEIDFSKEESPLEALRTFVEKDMHIPFNFVNGPLIRVHIVKIDEETYVLHYCIHHIAFDGWSKNILESDIFAYYEAFQTGTTANLDLLDIQYKDYATWMHNNLNSEAFNEHKNYWIEKLSHDIQPINLPSNKQRPKIMTTSGRKLSMFVPNEIVEPLRSFCSKNGASLYMGVLAVWYLVIYRYTAQKDILIGTALSERSNEVLKNQIGFYVNTLVLRNTVDNGENFEEFFNSIKTSVLSDFDHQEYPFDQLLDDLNLTKDISRNTLFDILFTHQNATDTVEISSSEALKINDMGKTLARFDVEVNLWEASNGITIDLTYNDDVYELELMQQFMKHYAILMKTSVSNAQENIDAIPVLSAEEKAEIVTKFNNYQKDFGNTLLLKNFQEIVKERGAEVALIYQGTSLTYDALDKKSNQVANFLLELGVNKGTLVPICLERSLEMVIGVYGILKAGAAFVPIGKDYPQERIKFILEEIQARHVITTTDVHKKLFTKIAITSIDLLDESIFEKSAEKPNVTVSGNDIAYAIYTSGTTGKPKGVLNKHCGIHNRLYAGITQLNITIDDTLVLKTPFTFDVSVNELLMPMAVGCKLIIAKPEGHKDPFYLQELLATEKISMIHFVPSMLDAFLESLSNTSFENLRHIICSGEALSLKTLKLCNEKLPNIRVQNFYGPTEAAIDVTAIDVTDLHEKSEVSIGYPLANNTIYIVNEKYQPQPIGVHGELLIGGIQVAEGYVNREELTKEKFIQSPLAVNERLYRTGDLAAWNTDGTIKYLGRIDTQVKIKGYRIELGEIEQVMVSIDEISNAVVITDAMTDHQELVAYYIANTAITQEKIEKELSSKLPLYMVPKIYMEIDKIPVNANGKLYRKLLPIPNKFQNSDDVYVAPKTFKEKLLVSILEEVLKYENIGKKHNFYKLGGDSIKSILVVSKLKQQGYTLKVDEILRNPVVEDLATLLRKNTREIDQKEVVGEVLLTPAQHYFFEKNTFQNKHHFNQSIVLRSDVALETETIEQTMRALTKHHDALRTKFTCENGQWTQYNHNTSSAGFTIHMHDLRTSENPAEEMDIIGAAMQSSFHVEQAPLARVIHFKLKEGDRVAFIVHHLLIDGISWRILMEDFVTVYAQLTNHENVQLPLKTDAVQHWTASLQNYVKSEQSKLERAYWEEVNNQFIIPIPKENESVSGLAYQMKEIEFSLGYDYTKLLLTNVHSVYNTNINDILITALGVAIKDTFGLEATVLEMEGHGREEILDEVDISRTIGWMTSFFPFVLDVSDTNSYKEALVKVKEDLRKIPNKGVGYGILKYLDTNFTDELEPSIVFNFLGDFSGNIKNKENASTFSLSNENIGNNVAIENEATSTIDVSGLIADDNLHISFRFIEELYSHETLEELKEQYQKHLTALISELSSETVNHVTPSDVMYSQISFNALEQFNKKHTIENVYPLAPMQESIYFQSLAEKNMKTYFEQISYKMKIENLEISSLKEAYQTLIKRHAVLRTKFVTYNDFPLQIVCKNIVEKFSFKSLKHLESSADIEAALNSIKHELFERNFQLEDPSQMSLNIVETGESQYEFIWSYNHILMDGWCMDILINDFIEIFQGLVSNNQKELRSVVPYANYISWLSGLNTQRMASYWRHYLHGVNQVTEVPYKKNVGNVNTFTEKTISFEIKDDLRSQLQHFCSSINITINTLFQGIWGVLLAKHQDKTDVVFGTVVSGRPEELHKVDEIVGLFSNTIPVRVQFDHESTVSDFLKHFNDEYISGNANHYLSLPRIQSLTDLGNNLINHLLVFQNYHSEEGRDNTVPGNENEANQSMVLEATQESDQPKYDFDIKVYPKGASIRVAFRFNEAVYDAENVEKLVACFESFIEATITSPHKKIEDLEIISEKEKEEILNVINSQNNVDNNNITVIDMFTEQVQKTPQNTALVFEDKTYTYEELDKLTNKLARYLQANGVAVNDKVALYFDRSDWIMIAILATLKAGAAYVPINTQLTKESKSHIINDASIKSIISLSDKIFELEFFTGEMLLVDIDFEADNYESSPLNIKDTIHNDAYIIYTSGSTGKPKGVLIGHQSLASSTKVRNEYYSPVSSYLLIPSFSFDSSIAIIWQSLTTGAALHLVSESTVKDAEKLSKLIEKDAIVSLLCVPSLYDVLLTLGSHRISSLQRVVVAGEKLTKKLAKKHFELNSQSELFNEYGPTENTIWASVGKVDAQELNTDIGKVIDKSTVYIVDSNLHLMPIYIKGELAIGGNHLAKEYINNEELTAKKFVNDPFSKNQKLYLTGDYGYMNPDGSIEFIGRNDEQVKIRGYRVELGEIETALNSKDDIQQSVVIAKQEKANLVLAAFVVSETKLQLTELRNYLKDKLPNYMIPAYFLQLETLPLTPNGKIDRNALINMDLGKSSGMEDAILPKTEEEKILVNLLKEILDMENISLHDDFFSIGGNSLHIMILVSRLEKEGFHLEVADAIEQPKIEEMASKIKKTTLNIH